MTNDVGDLLKQGIDRLAADATATGSTDAGSPGNLLRRARQHNRRRRQAIAGALAAGTAAVTAAAVIAATVGTSTGTNTLHSQTITYVATRAEQALSKLDQDHAIEVDTTSARNSYINLDVQSLAANGQNNVNPQPSTALSRVRAAREIRYTYRDLQLSQGFSATGQLVFTSAYGPVTIGGKPVLEAYGAAYPVRTQWHTPLVGSGPDWPDPALTCDNAGFSYPNWREGISKALACHLFRLGGYHEVNGIDALTLVRRFSDGSTMTLAVDPTTYLPVRITSNMPGWSGRRIIETSDLSWLAPTKANLATLHAAERRGDIPAGFSKLPSTDFPLDGVAGPNPG
jgi:hypothetical protein